MSCRNCERILVDRLTQLRRVNAVNADHEASEGIVIAVDREFEEFEQIIAGAGYAVRE